MGRKALVAIAAGALLALVVFAVMVGDDGDDASVGSTASTTVPSDRSPEVIAFVDAMADLPADPVTEPDTVVTAPPGGFDCQALAERFAPTVANPARLLAAAAVSESAAGQDLISAAQINVADGISACASGDMDGAADLFAAAATAIELLEEEG